MHKILFLDIDGVLNNHGNKSHQTEISNGKLIDKKKVKLLGKLIRNTGAKIVLHSGWRFWFDDNKNPLRKEAVNLVRLLKKQKIVIYDMTPDLTTEEIRMTKKFSLVKAKEILAWLDMHKEVETWAVLDDLDLKNEVIENHQIRTDASVGLTKNDIRTAEKLLNPPIETFDELYRKLREHDRENKIARPQENTLVVQLVDDYQINIYDNTREVYLEFASKDGQYNHFHPDYREAYDYVLEVLEQPDAIVEEIKGAVKKAKESTECAMICLCFWGIAMFLLLLVSGKYPEMSALVIVLVMILAIVLGIVLTRILRKCRNSAKADRGKAK